MTGLTWQKSSYCQEASACLYVAAAPGGAVHLQESEDHPEVLLTTGPRQLHALITAIHHQGRAPHW
ncbi:DUF397 domain-containing protein [Streptomyces sp. NPDC003032]